MPNQTIPSMDESRIKSIFSRLEQMDVQLDQDPLQYGPKRLNGKVATARKMASECERIYLSVSKDLQLAKSMHRRAELDFNLQMQYLLASDPEVRSNRNIRDRDAAATMKLRDEREHIDLLDVAIQDMISVMAVIKAKRADLKDIQGRLRDQMKLCQEEIGLGSHWGSRPHPGQQTPDLDKAPLVSRDALEQLNDLGLDDSEVHVDESTIEEEGEAPDLPDADASDAEVDALLEEVDKVSRGEEESTEEESAEEESTEEESDTVTQLFEDEAGENTEGLSSALGTPNTSDEVDAFFASLGQENNTPAQEDGDMDIEDLVSLLG